MPGFDWKFKLRVGKFAWRVKQKVCWHRPAMFCLYTFLNLFYFILNGKFLKILLSWNAKPTIGKSWMSVHNQNSLSGMSWKSNDKLLKLKKCKTLFSSWADFSLLTNYQGFRQVSKSGGGASKVQIGNFAKSPPYFCLYVLYTKVRWRFRKIL